MTGLAPVNPMGAAAPNMGFKKGGVAKKKAKKK